MEVLNQFHRARQGRCCAKAFGVETVVRLKNPLSVSLIQKVFIDLDLAGKPVVCGEVGDELVPECIAHELHGMADVPSLDRIGVENYPIEIKKHLFVFCKFYRRLHMARNLG